MSETKKDQVKTEAKAGVKTETKTKPEANPKTSMKSSPPKEPKAPKEPKPRSAAAQERFSRGAAANAAFKAGEKLTKEQERDRKRYLKYVSVGRIERKENKVGLAFVSIWIVGAAIFLAYPLIMSFWYSLHNIRMRPTGMKFTPVGFQNFTNIFLADADFPVQLVDYLLSTVISVPIIVVFALIIAIMLNQKIKGKGFFRLIFFLPVIIVSGPILGQLTEQGAGTISSIDTASIRLAIEGVLPHIIADPVASLFENMVTILWYSGVQILIFLSGLQKMDKSMYEAAKIDGGSGWECFWKITLPNLKSMILLNTVYTVVFTSNNDQNPIINLIQTSMFSGTAEKGYGYASAMAWLYTLVVLLVVGIFALVLTTRKGVYEKQVKKAKKLRKKELSTRKKVERRNARNAKRIAKQRAAGKITTHTTSREDY